MSTAQQHRPGPQAAGPTDRRPRLGCVSYLNAKPLIEGVEPLVGSAVRYDVPAGLLDDLEAGRVDLALCPVIDYYRSGVPLCVVPVGGIGCLGPTLTVRLFSRVPIDAIRSVRTDPESHTSVALLRVLLDRLHGIAPVLGPAGAPEADDAPADNPANGPEAMLLIGDKVVNRSPDAAAYPHQLDLGEAWHRLTGLPFVFAIWMARRGADLGDTPAVLELQRERNLASVDALVERHAAAHGWPTDLARRYLGTVLRYRIGPRELGAIAAFAGEARRLGLIERDGPPVVWHPPADPSTDTAGPLPG